MSNAETCSAWDPSTCRGTPSCPPRCPRYLGDDGTIYTIEPDAPSEGDGVGPDDIVLRAVEHEQGEKAGPRAVGSIMLRDVGDGTYRVTIDCSRTPLEPELARQAVAYAVATGAGHIETADPAPFDAAGFDLASTDAGLQLSLATPQARAVTRAPGSDSSQSGGGNLEGMGLPDRVETGRNLHRLFAPERVAVVGATDRPGSIGRLLMENLASYDGQVIPVTRDADRVLGEPAIDSLEAVGDVDLVVIAVPPGAVLDVIEAAGQQGIENAIVVSAGFEETGERGQEAATRLRDLAETYGMNVVGPNSMGVLSTASGLNATFSPRDPAPGSVSLLSQSGAFITATLSEAADRAIGFRHVVSVGNKTVMDAVDYLQYLDQDPGTEVIAAYLEDIERGEAFVQLAQEITQQTPIVLIKPGRTEAGADAAASHTGSLASDDRLVGAALDRVGVIRADSATELLDFAAAVRGHRPDGSGVGIVTNAGGPGVLATDAVAASDSHLATLAHETTDQLGELLPGAAAVGNPTDVLGDADVSRFVTAIDAIVTDPNVDVGLVVTTPHPLIDYAELAEAIGRCAQRHETPIVTCLMDGRVDATTRRILRQYDVPNFADPSRAAAAIDALTAAGSQPDPIAQPDEEFLDHDRIGAILASARDAGRETLGVESLALLEACGIDVPAYGMAATPAEAGSIAQDLDSPVVLKIASPDIAHKVDVGGVRTDVAPSAAKDVAADMLETVREAAPAASIDGILVQRSVPIDDGVEVVVGATASRFGPVLSFGLGGILVEHLEDVAFALAPLDRDQARALLTSIEAASVLEGARGQQAVDQEALVDVLVRLSSLVSAYPALAELDVNPFLATPSGAQALDLFVRLDDSAES